MITNPVKTWVWGGENPFTSTHWEAFIDMYLYSKGMGNKADYGIRFRHLSCRDVEGAGQVHLPCTHLHRAQQSSCSASQTEKIFKNEAVHIPQVYFPPLLTIKDLDNSQIPEAAYPEMIYQTDDLTKRTI